MGLAPLGPAYNFYVVNHPHVNCPIGFDGQTLRWVVQGNIKEFFAVTATKGDFLVAGDIDTVVSTDGHASDDLHQAGFNRLEFLVVNQVRVGLLVLPGVIDELF